MTKILTTKDRRRDEQKSNHSSDTSSAVSLRDLGTNRTLTLIDGRRVVSNSYSGNYVSLSTIPSGMVERVEIISGGASATYGADAVASVVNIITQSAKEGFGIKSRMGETFDGGGKEFTIDLDYGTDFDGGRGYMYFASTWDRQFGMSFYDRDRAQIDDITAYAQVQYSDNGAVNSKSPEDDYESAYVPRFDPVTGDPIADVRPGYIPLDNPYVPQALIDSDPYKGRIYWDRRFAEVGNISTDNSRTTLRSWAGLQGTVFDGNWEWDVSAGFGKFNQKQQRYNELNVVKVSQALQAEQLENGTIQFKDADARAEGCVPLNLFGEGSITPEMANWIRTNPTLDTQIEQYNMVGYMTGDLFELPAGMVSAVFGGEYRKDNKLPRSKLSRLGSPPTSWERGILFS